MEKVVQAPVQPVQVEEVKGNKKMLMKKSIPFVVGVLVILFGVGTGYVLARGGFEKGTSGSAIPGAKESATEAGVDDETLFPDQAEGMLKEGGLEGDGTHHLDRGMGEEKNVYLTSTVIDLQSFVGKEVQVWGESIASQKAGWLMDVGKIKIKN